MSEQKASPTLLASSAVMAAGTTFSRISGFLRSALLVAALGSALRADTFTLANTLPNMIYILVAGGVFNAVLVPQLVRAMKNDEDGGDGYANRIITLAAIFLAGVTVLLIVITPWVLRIYLDDAYYDPARAAHLQSVIDLTRLCLPQVFFYGMFVLVGQILNARGRFGPMMWAPIANNVVAVAMLVAYLAAFGRATGAQEQQALGGDQTLVLGIGSTLGIALQLLILLPYLKAAGFSYRPRFDFRDAGLGRTLSLGLWTVAFVAVNQVAYAVVVNQASGGTVSDPDGTGVTVYASAFLIMMVPHSIVTVSLATAILPKISGLATEGRLGDIGRTVGSTLRTSLALVLPIAALLPVLAPDVSNVLFGWSDGGYEKAQRFAPTLALFAPGLVFFTVHYLMLRGFYALEQTRRVFFIQCAISVANIALALVLVSQVSARNTAPALAVAYFGAYLVGSAISYAALRRAVGGVQTPALVRFLLRMLIAVGCAAAVAWLVTFGITTALGSHADDPNPLLSLARGGLAGLVGLAVVLLLAHTFRIREVTSVTDAALARLRRR